MSTTTPTTTTTTTRDRGDRYGPIEWAQTVSVVKLRCFVYTGTAGGSFAFTLGRIARGYEVRPDLCAVSCLRSPRSFAGQFYVDSLVHDAATLQLLVDVVGQVALSSVGAAWRSGSVVRRMNEVTRRRARYWDR